MKALKGLSFLLTDFGKSLVKQQVDHSLHQVTCTKSPHPSHQQEALGCSQFAQLAAKKSVWPTLNVIDRKFFKSPDKFFMKREAPFQINIQIKSNRFWKHLIKFYNVRFILFFCASGTFISIVIISYFCCLSHRKCQMSCQ